MAEGGGNGRGRNWEHLRAHQWKPGQSGNPAGRPKRPSIEAIVQGILDRRLTITKGAMTGQELTQRDVFAEIFVEEILVNRNITLMRELLDRVWPKTHHLNLGSEDGTVSVDVDVGPDRLEEVAEILDEVTRH